MIVVYGLTACDRCRRARRDLNKARLVHRFHDLRQEPIAPAQLQRWTAVVGWETLLNRRGATWRQLPETERADLDEARALGLMATHPLLIKRPVVEAGEDVLVGWTQEMATRLGKVT